LERSTEPAQLAASPDQRWRPVTGDCERRRVPGRREASAVASLVSQVAMLVPQTRSLIVVSDEERHVLLGLVVGPRARLFAFVGHQAKLTCNAARSILLPWTLEADRSSPANASSGPSTE